MNTCTKTGIALILAGLSLASPAWAAPMVTWSGSQTTFDGDGPWSMGFQFTTGASPVSVDALGAFDLNSDGFSISHQVGLWDAGGTLLASVTVTSADTLQAVGSDGHGFRYASIAPILLAANTSYVVGASDFGTGDTYAFNPAGFTVDPLVTFDGDRYESAAGLTLPTSNAGPTGWFGANLLINSGSSAPEIDPNRASLPLACLTLVMCASYRRRSRSQQI